MGNNYSKNRTESIYSSDEKKGKKKAKEAQVSRFISEGNPNIQGTTGKEADEQGSQNIEEQEGLS